jgi:1-acyl-sn-glycerol-3-phosphate acyltransferase
MSIATIGLGFSTRPIPQTLLLPELGTALIRIAKLLALGVVGPLLLLFVCIAPFVCEGRKGFRGWYWRLVPRSCGWLLWFLSIRVQLTPGSVERMAGDTNSLFAVNHRSHLDGFALLSNIPTGKWVTFGAKKELFGNMLIGRGFRAAGLVEIDRARGRHALDVLSEAVREMPTRRSLILFAEGTRSDGDGLAAFKSGVVLVARDTGRSIRPVVIANSDRLLPRNGWLPKAGTIHIDVLDSFQPSTNASVDGEVDRLRDAMSAAYARLAQ